VPKRARTDRNGMWNAYGFDEPICETHSFMILEICDTHMGSTNDSEALPEPFPQTLEEVEAAEWGEREANVVEEFGDGGFVVSFDRAGGKYEPLTGAWYYVPPRAGEGPDAETWQDWHEVRGRFRRDEKERRAIIMGRLNERTGFWWNDPTASPNGVPVRVAADGQKALAAYLFAMHRSAPGAIAEKLDKSESTIRQYLSDYKAGRTG